MKNRRRDLKKCFIAGEEAAPYGDEPDILLQLIGKPESIDNVADETASDWNDPVSVAADQATEKLFEQVASEVSCWFATLSMNKNSAEINAKTGYNQNNIYSQRQ
jgi:hypothetical protein